jgi:hypothetical protein
MQRCGWLTLALDDDATRFVSLYSDLTRVYPSLGLPWICYLSRIFRLRRDMRYRDELE